CEEFGVAVASVPESIISKSLVSDQIIIDTVVAKYCNSLPFYRQSAILKPDAGLDISRSTMDGWVMQVGELLTPMVRRMRNELLAGSYIQADETPVVVQTHYKRGRRHTTISRRVQRHLANRRLRRIRNRYRRANHSACLLPGTRASQIDRRD